MPGALGGLAGVRELVRPSVRPRKQRRSGAAAPRTPDADEHAAVSAGTAMKAAARQVTATAEKLNGDTKRRPSYPGELRAKHANMSTKIWVKVAMAIAYFLCVSVAAFILVVYYVFFWTPDPPFNGTSTDAPNRTACAQRLG